MSRFYRRIIVLLAVLGIGNVANCEWLAGDAMSLATGGRHFTKTVEMLDEYSCRINLSIPGMYVVSTDSGAYLSFEDYIYEGGSPVIGGFLRLPGGAGAEIEVEDCQYQSYKLAGQLGGGNAEEAGKFDYSLPSGTISLGEPGIMRDLRLIPIAIKPYSYDAASNTVMMTGNLTIKVTFNSFDSRNQKTRRSGNSTAFKAVYRDLVWNYRDDPTDELTPANYLILCPAEYAATMQELAEWKNQKGVRTTIVTLAEMNAGLQDADIVKSYLEYAYYNWEYPPDYVLLVGDETKFPILKTYTADPATLFSTVSYPGFYTDENYFARLEGNDYYPDVILGRICASNTTSALLQSRKIIAYEKTPNMQSLSWYNRGVVCADQTEASQRATKIYVRNLMLSDGGFSTVDSLFLSGQGSAIINWINSGRSFLNYRGSGWSNGWAGVSLYVQDFGDLTNLYKLPVVTGIGCGVAKFDEPSACFGEGWMTAGTVNSHTGAVAFIGPTWNTHTEYNDYLDRGIYEALFQDSVRTLGAAFVAGKMSVEEHYAPYIAVYSSVQEVVRTLFGQYILLSDPELSTRASAPQNITVTHPDSVELGEGILNISVLSGGGAPLRDLQVCAYTAGETFSVDLTDSLGMAALTVNPQSLPNNLHITVTGLDINTYFATIPVYADGQFISHLLCEYIENPPGDTLLGPGETIMLTDQAKNYGDAAADGVWGILTSAGTGLQIPADSVFYGDFLVNEARWGSGDFSFVIPENYTAQNLPLTITYQDAAQNVWNSTFNLQVHRPNIIFKEYLVDPGPDGILERGGTAELEVVIQNIGDLPAYNLIGTLTTEDEEIIIIDGSYDYVTFPPGNTQSNSSDPFVFQVSGTCPLNHPVTFTVEAAGDQGGFYYAAEYQIEIMVGAPSAVDPGQDEQNRYYAYESRDSIYYQAPDYQWEEISPEAGGAGTLIEFDPVTQIQLVDLPFDFVYYGEIYNRIAVSADGFIAPDSLGISSPPGYSIPFYDYISGIIAPLWYNMFCLVYEPGDVSYYYNEPAGKFLIEYHQWSPANTNMLQENLQIVICDPNVYLTPTGDAEILFIYGAVTQGAWNGSLCGIESPDQSDGILMWDGTEYPNTSFAPQSYTAIKFTSETPEIVGVENPFAGGEYIPQTVFLETNYPNPFNSSTRIKFGLPAQQRVKLEIYNILGERAAVLTDGVKSAGVYVVEWDASSNASGIYFIKLTTSRETRTVKCLMVK